MNATSQVSSPIFLEGAYGRRYLTKAAALKHWKEGKDFQFHNTNTYCSIRDSVALLAKNPSGIYLVSDEGIFSL